MKIQDVSVSGLSVSVAVGVVLQVPLLKTGTYNCSFKALMNSLFYFKIKWKGFALALAFFVTVRNTLLGSRTGFHVVAEVQTLRVFLLREDS